MLPNKIENAQVTLSVIENKKYEEIFEKLLLSNDISCLNNKQKFEYYIFLCNRNGLDWTKMPFQLIKFKGKEILYAAKNTAEQIRDGRNVSIDPTLKKELIDGIYIVTANAALPNGRIDTSTGAVSVENLKGEDKANAFMKAETKAKRRVTFSICGLGILDESEIEDMKGAVKINMNDFFKNSSTQSEQLEEDFEKKLTDYKTKIYLCSNLDDLKTVFKEAYTQNWGSDKQRFIDELTKFKDDKKIQLENDLNDEIPL